jgi:hypothetical protein
MFRACPFFSFFFPPVWLFYYHFILIPFSLAVTFILFYLRYIFLKGKKKERKAPQVPCLIMLETAIKMKRVAV